MNGRLFESASAAAGFSAALGTRHLGKRLHYFGRTSSTNDLALQAARGGAPHGTVFVADEQESGRGRRGRSWQSPPGLGLLFSVVIDASVLPVPRVSWIPIAAGLACGEGIRGTTPVSPALKWPNDIVIPTLRTQYGGEELPGWRKLGGILCESILANGDGGRSAIVAGIGLNVHHGIDELPEYAKAPPTSLALECGTSVDAVSVFAAVLEAFESRLDLLALAQGADLLREEAQAALQAWWAPNRVLEVQGGAADAEGESAVRGRFAGLDSNGWLRIRLRDGSERVFADAEILAVR